MSVESMAAALRATGLTPAEKLLLVGIANHDGDGGAWPSIGTLAVYLGASQRYVQRTLGKLVDKGLVTVTHNAGGNSKCPANQRPNLYRLHLSTGVHNRPPLEPWRGEHAGQLPPTDSSPKPSLEPSSIKPVADLTAEAPVAAKFLSPADALKGVEHPRVARWSKRQERP